MENGWAAPGWYHLGWKMHCLWTEDKSCVHKCWHWDPPCTGETRSPLLAWGLEKLPRRKGNCWLVFRPEWGNNLRKDKGEACVRRALCPYGWGYIPGQLLYVKHTELAGHCSWHVSKTLWFFLVWPLRQAPVNQICSWFCSCQLTPAVAPDLRLQLCHLSCFSNFLALHILGPAFQGHVVHVIPAKWQACQRTFRQYTSLAKILLA